MSSSCLIFISLTRRPSLVTGTHWKSKYTKRTVSFWAITSRSRVQVKTITHFLLLWLSATTTTTASSAATSTSPSSTAEAASETSTTSTVTTGRCSIRHCYTDKGKQNKQPTKSQKWRTRNLRDDLGRDKLERRMTRVAHALRFLSAA